MTPKFNAYITQINSGELKTKKLRVIKELYQRPQTIEYFRTKMGMSHQSVTAVLSILCDEGMVRMSSSADDKFSLFSLVDSEENQIILANQRRAEKRELFIARGLKDGFIGYDSDNKLVII
jgi:DNA-binding MarR family transcriptional regulator